MIVEAVGGLRINIYAKNILPSRHGVLSACAPVSGTSTVYRVLQLCQSGRELILCIHIGFKASRLTKAKPETVKGNQLPSLVCMLAIMVGPATWCL